MRYRQPASSGRDRGFVLVMVIAILVTITFAGTAFVVFMREASQAAANVAHLAQAELAARSGLEHAIRVIEESMELCVSSTGPLDASTDIYYTDPALDEDGDTKPDGAKVGWYRYFYDDTLGAMERIMSYDPSIDPDKRHVITGRKFDLSYPVSPVPRKRGEYVVYVEDLDGKLHANIAKWNGGLGYLADLLDLIQKAATSADGDITSAQTSLLAAASAGSPFSSTSEIARRAGITSVFQGKYALEKHFTVYPVLDSGPGTGMTFALDSSSVTLASTDVWEIGLASGVLVPAEAIGSLVFFKDSLETYGVEDNDATTLTIRGNGDCDNESGDPEFVIVPRPTVNVNTAPEEILTEIFMGIPWLASEGRAKSAALARYLCASRPFANRHDFEEAIFRVVGNEQSDGTMLAWPDNGAIAELRDENDDPVPNLTQHQFNDILNSTAPTYRGMLLAVAKAQSAYDNPDKPGVYEFDGWTIFAGTGLGPSQTGGFRSSNKNVTWSTELKFTSRFFHIYVVGRGWVKGAGDGSPAGVRRLHAIYDAKPESNPPGSSPGRIIWLRWNLSSRGSVSDITPPP